MTRETMTVEVKRPSPKYPNSFLEDLIQDEKVFVEDFELNEE